MKILHVISCCLLSALCVVESAGINVTGVVRGQVKITCYYSWAEDNDKYFCKESCSKNDILIQSDGKQNYKNKGRFSILNTINGVFTVTITKLEKSDSGKYWCGVNRLWKDTYTEVHLKVTDAPPTSTPSPLTSRPHVSTSLPNLSTTSPNLSTTFLASGDISGHSSSRADSPPLDSPGAGQSQSAALCVVESAVTKEVVGGQVTVGCSFTWAGTNNKYFCNGACSGRDILVETKGSKNVSQDRYSIEDKGGLFYVTIKNLMKTDSGTYWCGVERYGPDTYQEVHLTVTDAPPTSTTSTVSSRPHVSTTLPNLSTTSPNTSTTFPNLSTTSPNLSTTFPNLSTTSNLPSGDISDHSSSRAVSGTLVVIMVCVSLAVLVVGLILLLIYKWRRDRKSSNTGIEGCLREGTLDTTTQDSTYQTLIHQTTDPN